MPTQNNIMNDTGVKIYQTLWWRSQPILAGTIRKGTFYRTIKQEHILYNPPAITLAVDTFEQLREHHVAHIVIKVRGCGLEYSCTMQQFQECAFPIQRGRAEPQLALGLEHWTKQNTTKKKKYKKQPVLFQKPAQLSLFGNRKTAPFYDELGNYVGGDPR